jgi:DNA topoisomerase 2-associated protein PAT1
LLIFYSLDFEDTYDGLGDQLDESGDAFNDDTFGADASAQGAGKDFDFFGKTANVANTIEEEHMLYNARQPPPKIDLSTKPVSKPVRSGYERYAEPDFIPRLEANASLWGTPSKPDGDISAQQRQTNQVPPAEKKMMSLEEVEAMMRMQHRKSAPQTVAQPPQSLQTIPSQMQYMSQPQVANLPHGSNSQSTSFPGSFNQQAALGIPQPSNMPVPTQILQRPQQPSAQQMQPPSGPKQQATNERQNVSSQQGISSHGPIQILQRQRGPQQDNSSRTPTPQHTHTQQQPPTQPRQILQNPNRLSGHGQQMQHPVQIQGSNTPVNPQISHVRGTSASGRIVTHPEQLLHLTEQERNAFLAEDAKRAKRNHKIHLLSKDNGLMTPQDKNFITRMQLQQLVVATGGVDDQSSESALAEDFYYQVYSQIRGAPRQNPHQPANQFAQTYLFQTGGRYGVGGRRHPRGGDNHMQRMEQQVQRAVEAAKAKPKNKQLVIEGSLGKISFSNSKTPKPMLNIKRPESGEIRNPSFMRRSSRPHNSAATDRREVLRNIESVFTTLMKMEDHERNMPPPLSSASDPDTINNHMEWQQRIQELNQELFQALKVLEPIIPKYAFYLSVT